ASLGVERLKNGARELRDEVRALRERVDQLEREMNRSGRISGSFDPDAPRSATGTIDIQNQNAVWTATVIVNGTSYVIPARQGRRLERTPAGPFTYSVFAADSLGVSYNIRAATTATLVAGNTFSITINP